MNELKQIEALIAKYFDLLYFGDVRLISTCFWPQASVNSVESGQIISIGMDGFADRLKGRPSPSSINENRIDALKLIELESPTTALIKVEVQILGDRYHDYLNLMKCNDEWKIICKVFHRFQNDR